MAQKYARGSRAWGICARSGRKMLLKDMVFDGRFPNLRVDPDWYEGKHPQEYMPKVDDPVALFHPAPDVINGPTAPVLVAVLNGSPQLTWSPSETAITEVQSYLIFRNEDAGEFTQLIECVVQRDFLGGIIGIQHCTTTASPDDDTGLVISSHFIEDAPVTYLDASALGGHTYCYYVQATPMGNTAYRGSGPPSPPSNTACVAVPGNLWARVDGAVFTGSGESVAGVALIDASHAVVGGSLGNIARTTDGGATWHLVAAATDSFVALATDGSHVVGQVGAGPTGKLRYSADQGATWSDATPGGFAANNGVSRFPGIGKFLAFDSTNLLTKVATSSTGAPGTWTVTNLPDQLVPTFVNGGIAEANGCLLAGGDVGGSPPARIERSTDGNTWTVVKTYAPGSFAAFISVAFNGSIWNFIGLDNTGLGHFTNFTSADNGLTWTQRVNGPQTAPPYISWQVALGTKFICSSGNDGTFAKVGVSSDNGVSFVDTTLPVLTFVPKMLIVGTEVYAFGNGVLTSSDAVTWATELALDPISDPFFTDAGAIAGLTVAIGNDINGLGVIYKRTPSAS